MVRVANMRTNQLVWFAPIRLTLQTPEMYTVSQGCAGRRKASTRIARCIVWAHATSKSAWEVSCLGRCLDLDACFSEPCLLDCRTNSPPLWCTHDQRVFAVLGRPKAILPLMLRRLSRLKKWQLALPSQNFGGGTGLTTAAISCGRCGETFLRQRLMCSSARSSAALHSHTRLTTAHSGRSGAKPVGP